MIQADLYSAGWLVSLRQKNFLITGVAFVGLIALFYFTSQFVLLRGLDALEQQDMQIDVARVQSTFSSTLSPFGNIASDWASWGAG